MERIPARRWLETAQSWRQAGTAGAEKGVRVGVVKQLRAFVIMPFDQEFDEVYTELIAKPLEEAGYGVQRADDVEARQNVLADVVRGIAEADLIVADVTTANPNVFYELGLAHAMGVPTVLIAQQESAEEIPFDLRQYRTEFYDTHFHRAKAIADALSKLGSLHAAGEASFGSPISDFLPGAARPAIHAERTGGDASKEPEPADDRNGGGRAEAVGSIEANAADDDAGLIDFVEAFSEAGDELGLVLGTINASTESVGSEIAILGQQMNELDAANPAFNSQAKRLLLHAASVLDGFADNLEARQGELEQAVDKVTSNGLGYLTLLAENPKQFGEQLDTTRDAATGLRDIVADASRGVTELRDSIAALPPMLKQTNRARNRTVRALDVVIAQVERVRSYAEQSIRVSDSALVDG